MTEFNEIDDDQEEEVYSHDATYSPEDNKIRIYPGTRIDSELSPEEYKQFKAAGYKWASKQECFVCARWTPTAEDWALRLCGEIGDEDYSAAERSADRAERFSDYREKRRGEAHGHADSFESGPSVFGHQNRQRAERQAARHDRQRGKAISQWSKAEYWQNRTAGVIAHALHRAQPSVRRGRILTIESNQRKHESGMTDWRERYANWQKLLTMQGADEHLPLNESGYTILDKCNAAQLIAYSLSNSHNHYGATFYHPTSEAANEKAREVWAHGFSAHDFMTHDKFIGEDFERFTPRQYAELYLQNVKNPDDPSCKDNRWSRHYELRLTYERAMLENEGGSAAAVEMEPGGFIMFSRSPWQLRHAAGQWLRIEKISKSPTTKKVTSVGIAAPTSSDHDKQGKPYGPDNPRPLTIHSINIQRLGEDAYRAPTDEERAAFKAEQDARKKTAKAASKANPAPSLINPTDNDAERLQALWNARAKAKHEATKTHYSSNFIPSEIVRLTQAKYSELSKGTYSRFETGTIDPSGMPSRRSSNMYSHDGAKYDEKLGQPVCKIRMACAAGSSWSSPRRVVVITDKPQKPLPIDWEKAAAALIPADELASA